MDTIRILTPFVLGAAAIGTLIYGGRTTTQTVYVDPKTMQEVAGSAEIDGRPAALGGAGASTGDAIDYSHKVAETHAPTWSTIF